jgi:ABC-type glycerol-3-phosphate transport system substrate-binding protein
VRRITYWEKWTGFEGEAAQAVVEDFNRLERERAAREPGYVPIEVEKVTVGKLHEKLLVAIAGGDPPDVAGAWTWLVYAYAEKGALQELGPLAERDGITGERYLPAFWDAGWHLGKLYALPTTPATTALHWNRRLLREAGLDGERPPATLQELDAYAEQLTVWELTGADGRTRTVRGWRPAVKEGEHRRLVQVGFLPTEPNWWPWAWTFYFGGTLWDGSDRITCDTPEHRRALAWCRSYAERIGVQELRSFASGFGTFSSPQNPFLDGRLAMQIQGVWMANFIQQYAPGMEWGAAPFPPPADRPDLASTANVEADVLVIPAGCRHLEEAWAFVRYAQSQAGLERYALGHVKFSPLREESAEFRAANPHPQLQLFRDLASSPHGFSTPKLGIWREYQAELAAAFEAVMNAELKPGASAEPVIRQALGSAQARIQASLDRQRRMGELRR